MGKIITRRRSLAENPEEVITMAQRLLEQAKRQWKWLALILGLVVVVLAVWFIRDKMQERREEQAALALARLRPPLTSPQALKALEVVVRTYPGAKAAREAQLLRANLLYQVNIFAEAAKAYESLLPSGDPVWDLLLKESLSYCYEALKDYRKAVAALKAVEEGTSGPLKSEASQRLALLLEQTGDFKEAAVYWKKLVEAGGHATMLPYLKEKLAAAEARSKK